MEFTGTQNLDASPETAWLYFTDTEILEDCAPGVKEMELKTPAEVHAILSVGVGSVKPTFDVDMVVTSAEEPTHLKMKVNGDASRNAFEAVAEMNLVQSDNNHSTVEWTATASVSGLLASLGQRAVGSVTKRLVADFFNNIEQKIEEDEGATSQLQAAENETTELTN